jgi:hypothetical protein
MALSPRNADNAIVATFRNHAIKNDAATAKSGRLIFDDMEVCDIRFAGSRSMSTFPATAVSHWDTDPETGEQVAKTYAERFNRQYHQFKSQAHQTKSGTPLQYVPFLTEGKRAELRALNIYTVEALASIDGQELKNLGQFGRDLKNKAQEFMQQSTTLAPSTQLQAELDALKARNAVLEEDSKALKSIADNQPATEAERQFDNMDLDQLREFITTATGHAPHGSMTRKTLVRMAVEAQKRAA